ncbi:MAG: hypothetical protein ACJA04_000971 [Cellvibrionaceae bacterium]|jgi:hypothetical protein
MIQSPWTKWWQDDFPCEFDKAKTNKNNQYLIKLLGENWLKKRILRNHRCHPLLMRWLSNGCYSYLELNALAEDIRLIENKPNFKTILNGLKSKNTCIATWHVIHCAAMFERGEKCVVSRFHAQTSKTSPDFSLNIDGKYYPVECKRLIESDYEVEFNKYAKKLLTSIKSSILTGKLIYPQISIVIKCYESLPEISRVTETIKEGMGKFQGQSIKGAFEQCNIFIDPQNLTKKDFSSHKSVYIFCPRSIKENTRVEGRIKSASKQLKQYDSEISGLVCIGIGQHQDPYYIGDKLVERFKRGELRSVSGVILLRSGTFLGKPKYTVSDLTGMISNVNATMKLPRKNLKFRPLGMHGTLTDDRNLNEVSSYRVASVEGTRVNLSSGTLLSAPNIKYIPKEMLE